MTNESGFDLDGTLEQAVEHHNANRLAEAEAAYRRVLAAAPGCADALHGLAILHWQLGRLPEALEWVLRATAAAPDTWRYHLTHGLLANAAQTPAEAAAAFRRACDLNPESADAWAGLAAALQVQGQAAEAIAAYRKALALAPQEIETLNNLATALDAAGHTAEAIDLFNDGLRQQPGYLPLYNNLGNALIHQHRFGEAAATLRQGLELAPETATLWFNYGNALAAQGAGQEAQEAYRKALELEPDNYRARVNLANTLRAAGDPAAAVEHYRRAIAIAPDNPDAFNNLGVALLSLGEVDEAIDTLHRALERNPDAAVVYNNLGNALKDAGRMEEAIAAYRQAIALDPDDAQAHSNLIYSLYFHPDYDEQAILREARHWVQVHAAAIETSSHGGHEADPKRRLRIGYVSPDFRNHCQALFTTPLLSHHNHTEVEIYCYADLAAPDAVSERIAALADHWCPIYGLDDDEVAAMIRRDRIDILVDLTMHMANGRPLLFARKPAPVQVAWLAYPGTTGQPAIDYRLTDPWLDPPELGDERYAERSIRLPDTFWCYDPLTANTEVSPLPADEAGHLTFGCLNNFCKVTDGSLRLWARVLGAVPGSRLLLMAPPGRHREHVREVLARHGVTPDRIEFVPFQPRRRYLETYHRIDLCLDTIPYNGHTTSLDAYWMGVPVITRVGATVVGRAGWSQLNNLGLAELAAFGDESFVDTAVALASDLARLEALRQGLRGRMQKSPLMDGKRFAAEMEAIYRQVWQQWCGSAQPTP